MPPKKGIVKSGNAGNSSKSANNTQTTTEVPAPDKALFPPGYKWPLTILNERCQKNGWDKANVETRQSKDGFSFVVTISKLDKKTAQKQTVRLEPHPPYFRSTSIEARHWGATYALHRVCSGMQYHIGLPPGPREYWTELTNERKLAPEHMAWMWDSDPFAARRAVDDRQAKAAAKRQAIPDASTSSSHSNASREFDQAPEVKMSSGLRDKVESAIKQAIRAYPEVTNDSIFGTTTNDDMSVLVAQLQKLGFKATQANDAAKFLSRPSAIANKMMDGLSIRESAVEYLMLHLPECDLPQRFLPANNSSVPFVSSTHAGSEDIGRRWLEERAIKECGWPSVTVKAITTRSEFEGGWVSLIEELNFRLIGQDFQDLPRDGAARLIECVMDSRNQEEIEAVRSVYIDAEFVESSEELIIPLCDTPMRLHVLMSKSHGYPNVLPPMFITSAVVPAYVRLHCLSKCLEQLQDRVGAGEGVCFAAAQFIEEQWLTLEKQGPPDISHVMRHILIPSSESPANFEDESTQQTRTPKSRRRVLRDNRTDAQVRVDFEKMQNNTRYAEVLETRKRLPASNSRAKFLETVESSRVVVVVGETGCGKTTQLPQFLLDSLILSGEGKSAFIIVTQPRRLSATSVARRVSAERVDDGSVGYAIRGESKQDSRTKILFCTTGVVLRRLGSGDKLESVTHIIIDEVHERSVDGDLLMLEVRELLKSHLRLRVVLMSATIDHETFVKYFHNASLIYIPGFTHPVANVYLEDIIDRIACKAQTNKEMSTSSRSDAIVSDHDAIIQSSQHLTTLTRLSTSNNMDPQLVASVVNLIISRAKEKSDYGAILVFVPGVREIGQCIDLIEASLPPRTAVILPLHSNLSSEEQSRVFHKVFSWKIVVSTNVAETSITIDDVTYVVDSGKVRENQYNPENGLSCLKEKWISRAAAMQRRGRAGRTRSGVCYKLYTRKQEEIMDEFSVPEMLRVPLESILLSVKVMRREENPKLFLKQAIHPPDTTAIDDAWSVLKDLGAIDQAGDLTALGQHMALVPVDLRLSKMLILGTIFCCLDPVLTIAACLSSKPISLSPPDKREEAHAARQRFSTGKSDLLTDCHIFNEYMRLRSRGESNSAIRTFCEQNFVSQSSVREVWSLRHEFLAALADTGFVPRDAKYMDTTMNTNSTCENVVKAVILGGFWPFVARVSLPKSAIKFDKVQAGTVRRENDAREFKIFDISQERVFLHPSSILFSETMWTTPFVTFFRKQMTTKIFLRDVTQVPLFALLLFGGPVTVHHLGGGLSVGTSGTRVKLKAWPRIGVLVNQLRKLLDAQLGRSIEKGSKLTGQENPVMQAMLCLLKNDGLEQPL
ncbi:P-loop containing nucleoside triphosphate hydrolase protein [Rickenella mellea]|uniref:P-loop containing nucleoside triphosphate hydrolase protein n=1 Tax=Rickenella mellea TaxID=50990 RepID=A0A4Y7QL30_9AGAM|nr:P-loop containing nucleoside triphosphate hydrolase protein [Rickenella mellea]